MALGAEPVNVLGMVIRQGVVLGAIGVAVGAVGALWLTRFIRGLLFAVDPLDPLTFDFTWPEIVAATGATLETTYGNLTGVAGGLMPFKALLHRFLPEGTPTNLTVDNPFPLLGAIRFPFCGAQFRTTLPAHASQLWFTYNWPVLWDVVWTVIPTNAGGPQGQVSSSVSIQKGQGGNLTYWITINNLTGTPVDCEARYTVLCA